MDIVISALVGKNFSKQPLLTQVEEEKQHRVLGSLEKEPHPQELIDKYPELKYYHAKHSMMTFAEQNFFRLLQLIASEHYFVIPQMNLDKLFWINTQPYHKGPRARINRRSVDFVLVDKKTLKNLLAIELDDSSHEKPAVQKRDDFVNAIFNYTGMPLLRVHAQHHYQIQQLRELIDARITLH